MTSLQEIVDLADAMQLRGNERKAFIAEEMDKLHNLQTEEREKEREVRLQAEEREKEGEARLKVEETEIVTRLQAEENEMRGRPD